MSQPASTPAWRRLWAPGVALVLWVATLLLGMQALYAALQLYYLFIGAFGFPLDQAQRSAPLLVCGLGLVLMMVVLGSAEYHRTRVGQPKSSRLFAWVLGVELAVVLLYYFLF
jgi:hypothetical protein